MRSIFSGLFFISDASVKAMYRGRIHKITSIFPFSVFIEKMIKDDNENMQFVSMFNTKSKNTIKSDLSKLNLFILNHVNDGRCHLDVSEDIIQICKNAFQYKQMPKTDDWVSKLLALYFIYKSSDSKTNLNPNDDKFAIAVAHALWIIRIIEMEYKNNVGDGHLKTTSNGSKCITVVCPEDSTLVSIIKSERNSEAVSVLISMTLDYLDCKNISLHGIIPYNIFQSFYLSEFILKLINSEDVDGEDVQKETKVMINDITNFLYDNKNAVRVRKSNLTKYPHIN